MQTKLTLRMDQKLVAKAKREARKRGKSVSGMVADFFAGLAPRDGALGDLPPITRSLVGAIADPDVSEEDYHKYLEEKYR